MERLVKHLVNLKNMIIADSFFKRLRGLAWNNDDSRSLLLPRCSAVHTFGMRYDLTLFWFQKDGAIVRIDHGVVPKTIKHCRGAYGVLECGKGNVSVEEAQSWIYGWVRHTKMVQKSFKEDETGQALVETALLLPIIVLFVFGFLQVGILMFQKQQLLYVNNYSVQVGSITNDDTRVMGAIEESFDLMIDEIVVDINTVQNGSGNDIDSEDRRYRDTITVRLQWDYPLIIPLFSLDSIELQTKASARILCREDVYPHICE